MRNKTVRAPLTLPELRAVDLALCSFTKFQPLPELSADGPEFEEFRQLRKSSGATAADQTYLMIAQRKLREALLNPVLDDVPPR